MIDTTPVLCLFAGLLIGAILGRSSWKNGKPYSIFSCPVHAMHMNLAAEIKRKQGDCGKLEDKILDFYKMNKYHPKIKDYCGRLYAMIENKKQRV